MNLKAFPCKCKNPPLTFSLYSVSLLTELSLGGWDLLIDWMKDWKFLLVFLRFSSGWLVWWMRGILNNYAWGRSKLNLWNDRKTFLPGMSWYFLSIRGGRNAHIFSEISNTTLQKYRSCILIFTKVKVLLLQNSPFQNDIYIYIILIN